MPDRIVITAGTFDLLHQGHLNLFKACRRIAGKDGKVIVFVNTDEFVVKFKGKMPVQDLWTRSAVVEALRDVDQVLGHSNENTNTIRYHLDDARWKFGYDAQVFLVVGSDWAKKDYYKQIGMVPGDFGTYPQPIQLIYVPYSEGVSSSEIRRRMKA